MGLSGEDHRRELDRQARQFARHVAAADPRALVPDCPQWTVQDLVLHIGGLYRWSTRLVEERITTETWRAQMDIAYPADDASAHDLSTWVSEAIDPMLSAFEADDWTPVWTWGQSQQVRFWPRRMLFETVVHGIDLDRAITGGGPSPVRIAGDLAADCLDECFEHLPARGRWARDTDPRSPVLGTVVLAPADMATTWRIRCRASGMWWDRGAERADVTLRGPVGELIALVHQRGDLDHPVGTERVQVQGDIELAVAWLERLAF